MEDYQEQEYEFWRRLDEESLDRGKLLRRGLAAGAGLTILSLSDTALAARARALANPPLKGTPGGMKALIAAAKKEGKLNDIALPDDWANYGGMIAAFKKKYGMTSPATTRAARRRQENQAIVSLKGDPRGPDCRRRRPLVRGRGCGCGPLREVLREHVQDDPACDEGHAWLLDGRLLGRGLDRLQRQRRAERPAHVRGPG